MQPGRHPRPRPCPAGKLALFLLLAGAPGSLAAPLPPHDAERENPAVPGEKPGELLSDEVIPLQLQGFPTRPRPLLEIGESFLAPGPVGRGFRLPTGAVWQPSLMVWGNYRTGTQVFQDGEDLVSEWANGLSLFGQLGLTPTERLLGGVRVLDREGRFTGFTFHSPAGERGFDNEFNVNLTTLFFEGDFGELFPRLDSKDRRGHDFGFSVGRQPLRFQRGLLLDDFVDAVGVSKVNLRPPTVVNLRSTFIWGWDELNRTNLEESDRSSSLFGLFNEIDWRSTTVEVDAVYVKAHRGVGSGAHLGLGATQRIGDLNTTFRVLASAPIGPETAHNRRGLLLFGEVSRTLPGRGDYVYATGFLGLDHFRSASRDALAGGPLNAAGILFEAVGLGRYPAPISNQADEAFGGAIGYQRFFAQSRRQLVLELGGRYATSQRGERAIGIAPRYQIAFGQRGIIRWDACAVYVTNREPSRSHESGLRLGVRAELAYRF